MRVIFLLLVVSAAAVTMAVRILPWWALPGLFGGMSLAVVILFRWSLPRLLEIPFKAKGAVLRDAMVDVRSVERVEASAPEPSDPEPATAERGPREYFRLEVTITPRAAPGPFALWEPGELRLVGPEARAGKPRSSETEFDVSALEVLEAGRFQPDSGMKYGGPQRLRLLVAVPPGQRRLRLRYYFEVFGNLPLPGPPAAEAFHRRPLATTR